MYLSWGIVNFWSGLDKAGWWHYKSNQWFLNSRQTNTLSYLSYWILWNKCHMTTINNWRFVADTSTFVKESKIILGFMQCHKGIWFDWHFHYERQQNNLHLIMKWQRCALLPFPHNNQDQEPDLSIWLI